MWFKNTRCKYDGRTSYGLARHQKEIHEPEALARNGYGGGDEPALIHTNRFLPGGRVKKSLERNDIGVRNVGLEGGRPPF
jgi:hypothetical protein